MMALLFLSASPRRVERARGEEFRHLSCPLMLLSAAWGVISVWLWQLLLGLTWPRMLNWVVPAAVTAMASVLLVYRQAILSLLQTPLFSRRLSGWPLRLGVLGILVGVGFMLNYGVRYWDSDQINNLPASLQWLWPEPLYRVMFLSNLWGGWAMIVLVQFHRPVSGPNDGAGDITDAPTREFAASAHPLWAGVFLLIPLSLSLIWLSFLHPHHFIPPLAAIVAALGLGSGLVRLHGGLCRSALLAANFLTQGVFWLAYLAVIR